jgi:hypothetical protein
VVSNVEVRLRGHYERLPVVQEFEFAGYAAEFSAQGFEFAGYAAEPSA